MCAIYSLRSHPSHLLSWMIDMCQVPIGNPCLHRRPSDGRCRAALAQIHLIAVIRAIFCRRGGAEKGEGLRRCLPIRRPLVREGMDRPPLSLSQPTNAVLCTPSSMDAKHLGCSRELNEYMPSLGPGVTTPGLNLAHHIYST